MATLKDIALKANVTISTVSRALNGNTEIKKETRERIFQIARELNYLPNKSDNDSSANHLQTIGVICPEIKSNFYANIVNTMGDAIKKAGYSMIVGLTNFKYENELHYLNLFEDKKVDGIVFITSLDERVKDDLINFRTRSSIPVVQLASFINVEEYDCIKIDEQLAMSLALSHLIELGHKDIAFVGETLTRDRQNKFAELMLGFGLKADSDLIKVSEERFEEAGYAGMKAILSAANGKLPTAVIASYDDVAIGAMRAIFESGLRIPEDISVMGIDNIFYASFLYRALTTISIPVHEMTKIAIKILLDKIGDNSNKVIQHVVVKPELVVRETTAKVPEAGNR